MVQLLDCTLRDGAYLIDKTFGDNTIKGIIAGLVRSHIDFIEVVFFQNEGFGEGKTVFKNSADVKRYIPKDKHGCEFTVLADYSRYSIENLDERTDDSIDAIRECFFKHERFDALKVCKEIKKKGYKLFVQPVDILGYSDIELIEFLQAINEIEPYCFSIVDTFGSMYQEDLHRVFELINHNLAPSCKIGFHSHNNLQLSSALSQEFIRMSVGKREVVVDGTLSGMGRGAGNTPIELVAQYLTSKLNYGYEMDALLDVIDCYMDNIRSRCSWGYTTQYFVAGSYSAHVNNIAYLSQKNSIRSKDIRYILNKIGVSERKRYNYDLLEKTYLDLMNSEIDDTASIRKLKDQIGKRPVLVLVPGHTIISEAERINNFVIANDPLIISVNFVHDTLKTDYVYMSNVKRYEYWKNSENFVSGMKILTSNICDDTNDEKKIVVSFPSLIKCGWEHFDNSTIMLLRLLDRIVVSSIAIAGFDGYSFNQEKKSNYASRFLESSNTNPTAINTEIMEMLSDYMSARVHKETPIKFITSSRFEKIVGEIK